MKYEMHANVNGFSGLHTLDNNNVTCTQTHAARNLYGEKLHLKPLFRCNTRATIASDAMWKKANGKLFTEHLSKSKP